MKEEIEVKIKINSVGDIKKKLNKLGISWSTPRIQVDSYYRQKEQNTAVQRTGSYILRIRQSHKAFFTIKILTGRRGVWEEYETQIEDPRALEKILSKIGFMKVLTLHKKRISTKYKKFSLEIDQIKELGNYLEAEAIGGNGKKIQREIIIFFLSLGLPEENIERRGYPEIIFESQGQKFEGQA